MAKNPKVDKKRLIIIVAVILIGVAAFLLLKKSSEPADPLASDTAAPDWDESTYQKMVSYFKQNADSTALHWMNPLVKKVYTGETAIHPDYLIDGKVTKCGAFLAVYAAAYHSNPNTKFKIDRQKFNEEIYNMFYQVKASKGFL